MKEDILNNVLQDTLRQLYSLKQMGERAVDQLNDDQLHHIPEPNSLNIATIMKHLATNMVSRWTDFLTSDGEKEWRRKNREDEFVDTLASREELLELWNQGWSCFMDSVKSLSQDDLGKIVYIRNEGFTVVEAINRGLTHASYHIGQIVYLAKMYKSDSWHSLSIPKGESEAFNEKKFSQAKSRKFH